jgi:hypothetical protein
MFLHENTIHIKMELREVGCEDVEWIQFVQGRVECECTFEQGNESPVTIKVDHFLSS